MGIAKNYLFSETANQIAAISRILSNAGRVEVLRLIIKQTACICNDISKELGMAQPTVSLYLKELKQAGLIKGSIDGPKMCYCIDNLNWQKYGQLLGSFFSENIQTPGFEPGE